MQSRRDYLVSLGLAKPGRGKFSNDAKSALSKAEAEGMKFSDTVTPTGIPPQRSTGQKSETAPKPTGNPGDTPYLSPSDFRFPEADYKAVGTNGKTYGMREVCSTCRVSLTNHMCNAPVILGNIGVHIRKK